MENWGLVAFGDSCLLWDPVEDKTSSKLRAGSVTVHELVHMWFGDLGKKNNIKT